MFNIEDKIKSWFKNNVWNPIVSQTKKDKKEEDEKKEETTVSGLTILTDEELKQKAHDSLVDDYNLKKSDLKKDLDLNTEKINANSQEQIKEVEGKKDDVKDYYDNLNKKVVNDSVKKGVSRSSIVEGQVDKNNSQKQKEFYDIESKIADIISSGEKEIDYYNKKYQNKVDSLDSQFAIDVKEKFDKLKADQDKKIEEYNKEQENNKQPETGGDGSDDKPSTDDNFNEEEYHKLVEKYKNVTLDEIDVDEFEKLKEEDKVAIRQAIFDDILAYYYSMTPEQARESYKNDERIKRILGSHTKVLERYLDSYK